MLNHLRYTIFELGADAAGVWRQEGLVRTEGATVLVGITSRRRETVKTVEPSGVELNTALKRGVNEITLAEYESAAGIGACCFSAHRMPQDKPKEGLPFPAYSRIFPHIPAFSGKKYFAIRWVGRERDCGASGGSGMDFARHIFDAQDVMFANTDKTAYLRVSPRIFWGLV